jgi:hypothetical protein
MSAALFIWTGAGTSRIRAAGTLYPDIELPTEAKSKLEWAHPPALPLFAVSAITPIALILYNLVTVLQLRDNLLTT